MKTTYCSYTGLLCICLLLLKIPLLGQICIPAAPGNAQGIFPDTIPGLCLNTPYSATISIRVPLDSMVIIAGDTVIATIDSLVLDSITGLPPGLTYACQSTFCQISGGNTSCLLLSGTPNQAGNYSVNFYTSYFGTINGADVIRRDTLLDYYTLSVNSLRSTQTMIPATCGEANGSISIVAEGTAPYTYNWNTGDTGSSLNGLTSGEYIVALSDANSCVVTDTFLLNNVGENPQIIQENITWQGCVEDGSGQIDVEVSGGSSTYTYSWSHGPTHQDASALPAGSYMLTVTDSDNCSAEKTFNINPPAALDLGILIQTNVLCAGENSGSVSTLVSGGQGPYDLSWNTTPPSFGTNLNSLAAGTYTLTVKDSFLCQKTLDIAITEPAEMISDITAIAETDSGAMDGSILAILRGGISPYSYQWNTGETGPQIDSLKNGTYILTSRDANGCSRIDSVFLGQWAVGIDDELKMGIRSLSIMPNPNSGNFMLELAFNKVENLEVELFDLYGKVHFKTNTGPTHFFKRNIVLTGRTPGLYFLRVKTSLGMAIRKIVINE